MRSSLVSLGVVSLVVALALTGCGRKKHVRLAPPPVPIEPRVGQTEEGIASWYGHPYHGRQAADGEIYDMEKLVAAHRTLPFHTWVRVHNLDNDKAVDVEIIDRGPFIDGRIIDLSHAAAQAVALIGPGTAKVRIRIIEAPANAAAVPGHYAVQVGAFRDRDAAERLREEMSARYGAATLVMRSGNPAMWRVLVGDEPSEEGAGTLAERIRNEGAEKASAFVVRLDL
jgi:peptidoglycan lytic transglycosylase